MFYKLLNVYTRNFSFPHRGLKYFLKAATSLRIANKTYKKRLHDSFYILVNPTEHIQQQLFWYGHYEKGLEYLLMKALRSNDVFLDIGANIGYFSLLAANHSPSSTIVSFEPVNELFKKLKENIFINNFKNIQTVNSAVGDANEEKEIFLSANNNLGMSSFQQPENYSGKKEKVKVVAIDDWYGTSGLAKIDLVKLDVEGSELAALKGMKKVLETQQPMLIVEINPETLSMFNLKAVAIYNYLNQLNFDGYAISETGELSVLKEGDTAQTINVLFIHREKANAYPELFNT